MSLNNKIYLWRIADNYPNDFIGIYDDNNGPDQFMFKKCEKAGTELETPVINFPDVTSEELKKYGVLASNARLPIVGEEVLSILQEFQPYGFQVLDVKIQTNDGELAGYYLINVLNKVDGVDEEKSEIKYLPRSSQVMAYNHVVYKKGCLEGLNIARNKDFPSHLLISEYLKNRLNSVGNLGLELIQVSD